jgi:hypothetical protein
MGEHPLQGNHQSAGQDSASPDAIAIIAEALRGLRFGTVKLIVQDGVLIRIERTENRQLTRRLS